MTTLFSCKKIWIDPPHGWMYGFPAIWDTTKFSIDEFLREHHYPEKDIEFACQYMRMWETNEND